VAAAAAMNKYQKHVSEKEYQAATMIERLWAK
jgi:hypothetical protein